MTKAAARANGELMNGSAAISGAMRILPTVIAFGRFTLYCLASGERLQNQLADCLQRVEYTVAGDGDGLEVRNLFYPITT